MAGIPVDATGLATLKQKIKTGKTEAIKKLFKEINSKDKASLSTKVYLDASGNIQEDVFDALNKKDFEAFGKYANSSIRDKVTDEQESREAAVKAAEIAAAQARLPLAEAELSSLEARNLIHPGVSTYSADKARLNQEIVKLNKIISS
jgi:hypothetical protein